MITGAVKNQIDRIWDSFWSGGISNPLEVIEQITYLLFIRRLDDLHTLEENKANRLKRAMERRIFPEGRDENGRAYKGFGDAAMIPRLVRCAATAMLCGPLVVAANDLVLDDGGSHVIDYDVGGTVTVLNGSSVEFVPGGRATVTEVYAGGIVNSGGSLGSVIVNDRDGPTSFRMSAGEAGFVNLIGGRAEISGGVTSDVGVLYASLTISGDASVGWIGNGVGGGFIRIDGGEVRGHITQGSDSYSRLEINGGEILGDVVASYDTGARLIARGGTIHGDLRHSNVEFVDGVRVVGLTTAFTAPILAGEFEGGVWCGLLGSGFCSISIEGGEFSGPEFSLRGSQFGVFDVFGGSCADPFVGTDSSIFNIYGRNLRFDGEQLRGRLADGSQIRVPVQLFDAAEVRLFEVPEPTTLALTLLGIGLLLGTRARGRARALPLAILPLLVAPSAGFAIPLQFDEAVDGDVSGQLLELGRGRPVPGLHYCREFFAVF